MKERTETSTLEESRNELLDRYTQIEHGAIAIIKEGKAVSNPLLVSNKHDLRYTLSTQLRLQGEIDDTFDSVVEQILSVSPGARPVPTGFRHISLTQMAYGDHGRHSAHVDAHTAKQYYTSLVRLFQEKRDPMQLELVKIIPTIDREQNSVSIVAAFLPKKDTRILRLRQEMDEAVKEAGLPLESATPNLKVIFATLLRLSHPPRKLEEINSLLSVLDEVNKQLPGTLASVDEIDVLSSTTYGYIWTDKHIHMDPSISFSGKNSEEPRFITPNMKKRSNSSL